MTAIANRLIPVPSWIDVFHLSSEIEASDMTALEAVLAVDEERQILEQEANKLSELMASEDLAQEEADAISAQLVDIYDQLDAMESATAEARAAEILCGLGFTPQMQKKKLESFQEVGECVLLWPELFSLNLLFFFWTNQQTTLIWKPLCGWKNTSKDSTKFCFSFHTPKIF